MPRGLVPRDRERTAANVPDVMRGDPEGTDGGRKGVRQKAERKQPLSTLRCYTLSIAVVLNGCKLWVKAAQHVRKGRRVSLSETMAPPLALVHPSAQKVVISEV